MSIVNCEAELHRPEDELRLMSDPVDLPMAEACFLCAADTARRQQARSWGLGASVSLDRRRRDHGRRAEARDLLAPVYGWFTEGFDTQHLKEANALLEELEDA